jgi:3',5'-cyclic-AMP phosphodiesterase
MTRIAHLSDSHLDGSVAQNARLRHGLNRAAESGADHLLLTGDLTSSGKRAEFEELAGCLAGWPSARVTMVAGNHDGEPSNWTRALSETRLNRFRSTSLPGTVTDLGDATIVAVSSQAARRAPIFKAQGTVNPHHLRALGAVAASNPQKCVIGAMHHGPQWNTLQPFDGITNRASVLATLRAAPNLFICCGHDHRVLDLGRVFTAASVAEHDDPLRIYEIQGSTLVPTYRSPLAGSCWKWLTG